MAHRSKIRHLQTSAGFTMIELSIVIVIIGIILGMGLSSWQMLIEAREIAKTQSVLRQTKNCLLRRMTHSLQYPTYTAELKADCSNRNNSKEVDACLCKPGRKDAWGNRLRFINGINATDDSLAGQFAIDMPYHKNNSGNRSWKAAEPGIKSNVILKDGRNATHIVFVLISLGKLGRFDSTKYGKCFPDGTLVTDLAQCAENPDFRLTNSTRKDNDQFFVVNENEIRARLSN